MNKANFEKRLRHFVTKQPSGQVFIKVKTTKSKRYTTMHPICPETLHRPPIQFSHIVHA